MTNKEKIIKFYNKLINQRLSLRLKLKIRFFGLPGIADSYDKLSKKGYKELRMFVTSDFKKVINTNWGSAFPNTDSAFHTTGVDFKHDKIKIITKAEQVTGLDFNGDPVLRPTISGQVISKDKVAPIGLYTATIDLDSRALQSWDAWWFIEEHSDYDGYKYKYRELDVLERMYSEPSKSDSITSTLWKGLSVNDRSMYNHNINTGRRYKFKLWLEFVENSNKIRIYLNGIKIFVGLQWKPLSPLRMIIGSGILGGGFDREIEMKLAEKPYYFEVYTIKHYTK